MKKINWSNNVFIPNEDNANLKFLTLEKTTELANDLGLEVVEYEGDGTITIQSTSVNKTSIKAIKYDDDFYFFLTFNLSSSPGAAIALIDSNFDLINFVQIYASNFSTTSELYFVKASGAILFRSNNATSPSDYVAFITKGRKADGSYVPVGGYRQNMSSSSSMYATTYVYGKEINDNTAGYYTKIANYNTLIALTKIVFANAQLVCDHLYTPTHMGTDYSPKRVLLNGDKWLYSGSYSSSNPGNGIFVKLD